MSVVIYNYLIIVVTKGEYCPAEQHTGGNVDFFFFWTWLWEYYAFFFAPHKSRWLTGQQNSTFKGRHEKVSLFPLSGTFTSSFLKTLETRQDVLT